jgi:hypothetical protein
VRSPLPIIALLAAVVLAGCGGDDEATTEADTSTGETTGVFSNMHDPGEGAEGGPSGTLAAEGIGELEVGASEDEVRAAFGEPVDEFEVDLGGGGGEAPQVNLIYRFAKGDVTIKIDTKDDTFAAYDVYTDELETADGIAVGDPIAEVRKTYGDDLAKSPLGLDSLVYSPSSPGRAESPALTFAYQGKKITAISGGDVVQPAGE